MDIPDEIYFVEEFEEYSESREKTKRGVTFTFADGTALTVFAELLLSPDDMRGDEVILDVDGKPEFFTMFPNSAEMGKQSTAGSLLGKIEAMIWELPEHEKIICSNCEGNRECPFCNGSGCVDCGNTGLCQACNGRGVVLTD